VRAVAELKQDQEVAKEQTAVEERQRAGSSADTAADTDVTASSQDSQQTLEDTCEQFFSRLNEARRDAGRPEDLRVRRQCILARDAQAKLALIVAQCLSICVSVCDSLSHAYVCNIARCEPRRLPACLSLASER